MNISYLDGHGFPDIVRREYKKALKIHPKLSYKIKILGGDLYYEKMSESEAMDKLFVKLPANKMMKSKQDVLDYVRDNLNEKMPLDGPQLRVYVQDMTIIENG